MFTYDDARLMHFANTLYSLFFTGTLPPQPEFFSSAKPGAIFPFVGLTLAFMPQDGLFGIYTAFWGVLVVAMTMVITQKITENNAAVICAGILSAVSPLQVYYSRSFNIAGSMSLLFVLLVLYFYLRCREKLSLGNAVILGGTIGYALTVNYSLLPYVSLFALAVFWSAQIISALRCAYIAEELGRPLQLTTSIKAHFIGLWFNQVLPTSLGGDVLRVAVMKPEVGLGVALRSSLLDRFSGLVILMLVIAITLPLYSKIIPSDQSDLLLGLGILSIGFLVATLVLAWTTTVVRNYLNPAPLLAKFLSLISDIWRFRSGIPLWRQLWTSTVVHLNGIASYVLLGVALGFDVDLLKFALIVPLVFLVALVPISFAGWGIREAGAIWLFGLIDVPKANAFVLSVTYGSMLVIAGVPGLVMFIRSKHHSSSTQNG